MIQRSDLYLHDHYIDLWINRRSSRLGSQRRLTHANNKLVQQHTSDTRLRGTFSFVEELLQVYANFRAIKETL